MKNSTKNKLTLYFTLFLIVTPLFAQNAAEGGIYGSGHRSAITSIIRFGDNIISADEDGFIVIWDTRQNTAVERFQLTARSIKSIVKNPVREEVCIIESGGVNSYWITAWNYKLKEKLFSIQSFEPVTFINYSGRGNFIITAGLDGQRLALLDPNTGNIISAMDIPRGNTALGVTSRNEKNLFLYQSEYDDFLLYEQDELSYGSGFPEESGRTGQILYVDLASMSITARFPAPADLSSPVIFDNNRFIAGVNSSGLVLADAVSGTTLDTIENITESALLYQGGNDCFYCLNYEDGTAALSGFTVNQSGDTFSLKQLPAQSSQNSQSGGNIFQMAANNQTLITEIAASKTSIAVLTETGGLFFLPADYNDFEQIEILASENKNGYNRITAVSPANEQEQSDYFILWKNGGTRNVAQLINTNAPAESRNINILPARFPIRSISSKNGKLLTLDTAGNITIYRTENILTGKDIKADFTFSSAGTVEAALVDEKYFILCRSVLSGGSPFLLVNYNTGETVPAAGMEMQSAGIMVYSGLSGKIYTAAIQQGSNTKTVFYAGTAPAVTESILFEYPEEAVNLSVAESDGIPAIAAGSEGAKILANEEILNFERSEGLPVKLTETNDFFISLDSEGNVSWHNNKNGKLLAAFSLYEDSWELHINSRTSIGRISRSR